MGNMLLFSSLLAAAVVQAAPSHSARRSSHYSEEAQRLADPNYGPIPGESDIYNSYWGTDRPFHGNITDPVFPTEHGPPGVDDWTWQNLLSAEWLIFEFYQQGIEYFSDEDFVAAGLPANTHRRLLEIRNNEAGHLRLFLPTALPAAFWRRVTRLQVFRCGKDMS